MKRLLGSWFHRNAHSPARRAYFWFLRRFVGVFGKNQRVYFVNINGQRYKRVVFLDSALAAEVEQNLNEFVGSGYFPGLIDRHENELLLDFIEGQPFEPNNKQHLESLGDFFADVYSRASEPVTIQHSELPSRLSIDLRFLHQSGVIDSETQRHLSALGQRLQPDSILIGWDYVDPVSKNFLIQNHKLATIDVESLASVTPLGAGLAKAQMHWLDNAGLKFLLEHIRQKGGPDISLQMNYVALCFRVAWCKRKVLQGKRNFIARSRLDEWSRTLDLD